MPLKSCHPERSEGSGSSVVSQMLRFAQHDTYLSRMFLNQPRGLRAFSIVELLVVLAIVAILASIFIPYLATVRESERRVRCADNLRLVMQALHNYASLKDKQGVTSHDYPSVTYDAAR